MCRNQRFLWTILCGVWLWMTADILAQPWWPRFRGPNGLGIAEQADPPVFFGPSSNVLWKVELPKGNSSPCIWGDWIVLTGFDGQKLETLCLDRRSGKMRWRVAAPAHEIEQTHRLGSPATPTPVTDGRRVYVYFGSYGVLAYDWEGRLQWQRPLPPPVVGFGTASSPILAEGRLILLRDQDQGSHLLALDPETGRTLWRVERPQFRRGFATPFVWRHDNEVELVVPGSIWLKSYNLSDGRERWTYTGTSRVPCSSPVAGDGLLFHSSWNIGGDPGARISMPAFTTFAAEHDTNHDGLLIRSEIPRGPIRDRFDQMDLNKNGQVTPEEWEVMREMFDKAENALLAIRPGGHGEITHTHLVWKSTRSLPYVSSPLYYRGRVYTFRNGGLASCYDAATGKVFFQDERIGALGDYYSSAVAAAGRIYIANQQGIVVVLAAGEQLHVLARNRLREQVMATPAIVGRTLYYRTAEHLHAFQEGASEAER